MPERRRHKPCLGRATARLGDSSLRNPSRTMWQANKSSYPLQHRQQSTQRIRLKLLRDLQGTSSGPAQDISPAQHLTPDLHRNESWIGSGVRRHQNAGSLAVLPGSPAQQPRVARSVLSGEGQQRKPTTPLCSENPSFLFGGALSPGCAELRCLSFHPAVLPDPPPSA